MIKTQKKARRERTLKPCQKNNRSLLKSSIDGFLFVFLHIARRQLDGQVKGDLQNALKKVVTNSDFVKTLFSHLQE